MQIQITKQHEAFKETTSAELEALRSQHERITENETTSETKIAEREILSRHERRKRLREDLKKHTKLEHRLKHFMNDPQNEPDTSVKQIQIEEKSEMETMPVGFIHKV